MAEVKSKRSVKKTAKKTSKKTTSKKLAIKVSGKTKEEKKSHKENQGRFARLEKRKIRLITMNLIVFGSSYLVSQILLLIVVGDVGKKFFFILSVMLGVVTGTFVLVLLILIFMRLLKK